MSRKLFVSFALWAALVLLRHLVVRVLVPSLWLLHRPVLSRESIHALVKACVIILYEYLLAALRRFEALILTPRRVSSVLPNSIALLLHLGVYDWLGVVSSSTVRAWCCSHQQEVSDKVIAALDLNNVVVLNVLAFLALHTVETCVILWESSFGLLMAIDIVGRGMITFV